MFRIDNGIIYLTKGDSATLKVALSDSEGNPFEMSDGDELRLTVAEQPSKNAQVLFCVVSDTNVIDIEPSHTKNHNVGQYSCDIQLRTKDGHVFTVFPNYTEQQKLKGESNWKNFWLVAEVSE